MAVTTLSPWPTTPAALAAATACLKAELGASLTDERVQALGATAAALVEQYAPSAPQAVKNEATIRAAGYLRQMPKAAIRSEGAGPLRVAYERGAHVLRHSHAMAILAPWHTQRAAVIG